MRRSDRAVASEHLLMKRLADKEPVIETYIQELKPDGDLGLVPKNDFYFVGQLNMKNGLVDRTFLPKARLSAIAHLFTGIFHNPIQRRRLRRRDVLRRR